MLEMSNFAQTIFPLSLKSICQRIDDFLFVKFGEKKLCYIGLKIKFDCVTYI